MKEIKDVIGKALSVGSKFQSLDIGGMKELSGLRVLKIVNSPAHNP